MLSFGNVGWLVDGSILVAIIGIITFDVYSPDDPPPCIWSEVFINVFLIPLLVLTFVLRVSLFPYPAIH
jgi:hypothetical protein